MGRRSFGLAIFAVLGVLGSAAFGEEGPKAPQSQPDGSGTVLHDGLDGGDFSAESGLFYKKNHEQGAGTVRFQSGDSRHGAGALELSVRSQCETTGNTRCSERAEVWERPEVLALYDKTVWYAFSMKLADPIPTERHRYVMAQWKREIVPGAKGDYSPLLALRLIDGHIAVTVDTDTGKFEPAAGERAAGCRPGEISAAPPDEYNQFRALAAFEPSNLTSAQAGFPGCSADIRVTPRGGTMPAAASGWIDFVFMVKPGPRGDGRIEIAANGAWIATVEGHIGHEGAGLGDHQYFKFGPYRAGAKGPWTIYYDEFRRGPSCRDVAPESLCASIKTDSAALTP